MTYLPLNKSLYNLIILYWNINFVFNHDVSFWFWTISRMTWNCLIKYDSMSPLVQNWISVTVLFKNKFHQELFNCHWHLLPCIFSNKTDLEHYFKYKTFRSITNVLLCGVILSDIDIPTSFHLTITGLLLTDNNGMIFEVTLYRKKIFPRFLRYTRGMVKVKDSLAK